jgi:hypothetical protein
MLLVAYPEFEIEMILSQHSRNRPKLNNELLDEKSRRNRYSHIIATCLRFHR